MQNYYQERKEYLINNKTNKLSKLKKLYLSRFITTFLITAILTGCGGGSNDSTNNSGGTGTSQNPPTNNIPRSQTDNPTGTKNPPATSPNTPVGTTNPPTNTTPSTVTIGTVITDVNFQNLGAEQNNVPFTFGQVFKQADLMTSEGLAAKLSDGTIIKLQTDVKATHSDGSVRHAIISGVLPKLSVGQIQSMKLVKSTIDTSSSVAPSSLIDSGLDAKITVTIGGVNYTASLVDELNNKNNINWLSGNIANEWIGSVPLKDSNGNSHPLLTARFGVRWYSGLKKQARIEFIVENDKTFTSASKLTYDTKLEVAGRIVYQKTGLTHYDHSRWHQYAWWDNQTQPNINIQLNTNYLISTKAVPNYDLSAAPSESNLIDLANTIDSTKIGPMTIGPVLAYMPTTGGRVDIGSLPSWSVMWLESMDSRARDVMMAAADGSGSWSIHLRDEHTDYPVRTDNEINSHISTHQNLDWTGPLPVPRCVNNDYNNCSTPYTPDSAHAPSLSYLPYVITGDYYHLEELQFWAASNPLGTDPGNSGMGQGLLRFMQIRGQAWSLRTLGEVAYITPDNHPLKDYFNKQVDNNLNWYYDTYVVGNPNNLGVYDGSGGIHAFAVDSTSPWQDDFLTWSFGHLNELGFTKALPILKWKAKYSVGRMTDPGYCWIMGAAYNLKLFDANGKVWNSFADFYNGNYSGTTISFDNVFNASSTQNGVNFSSLACGSQAQADFFSGLAGYNYPVGTMIGYAGSSMGYPANMQPALAAAVDVGFPNANQAWNRFMSRASKPDYRPSPQWAILPR